MKQSTQAQAEQVARDGGVVVYWRPGCPYCGRLERAIGAKADAVTWVNIWEDDAAAAYVRSVNDGNEVVPTVVLDGIAVTNPKPSLVVDRLG